MSDKTQAALMRHFKFTADDLVYNRRGEIGPNQLKHLKRANLISTIMLGLFGLLLLVVLITSVYAWSSGRGEFIYGCSGVGSVVLLALGVWSTLHERPTVDTLQTVSGYLSAKRSQQNLNRRTISQYSLAIDGQMFPTDREIYHLLEHGGYYTVYYEASSHLILGIEPGGPTANVQAHRPMINPNRDLVLKVADLMNRTEAPDFRETVLSAQELSAAAEQLRHRPEAVRSLVTLIAEQPDNTRLLPVVEVLHHTAPDMLLAYYMQTDDSQLQHAADRCLAYLAEHQGAKGLELMAHNGATQRVREWAAAERAKLEE